MVKILCIAYPAGKDKTNVEVVDKDSSELVGTKLEWVKKSIETLVAPTGHKLKACQWHTAYKQKPEDKINPACCYTENPAKFSIWTEDCVAFDTCHLIEEKNNLDRQLEIERMEKLILSSEAWYNNALQTHGLFAENFEKREQLVIKIEKLKKLIDTESKPTNFKDPKYVALVNIRDRELNMLEKKKLNLTAKYGQMKENCGLEEFLQKYSADEQIAYDKAVDAVESWLNSRNNGTLSNLKKTLDETMLVFQGLDDTLKESFKIPFYYIYKARQNMQSIDYYYGKYKITNRDYTRQAVKSDLQRLDIILDMYSPFLQGESIEKIIKEVEREQTSMLLREKHIKAGQAPERW